ncbi:unnamed protein product [Bursaphelenchus okinawaensis]|uniref:Ig-like domain-containing protein n=1 Tax=Bursaphelenchus okinawaensis TaxID=465554 RepID=A0A811KW75_9BILA|nr:unnamed protein product [Bursaphelenchus okinawaensis]CAG9112412.1 unnamed protein product [Bursaphelenchus okinawaensis]
MRLPVILLNIHVVFGYTHLEIQENQLKYQAYHDCIRHKEQVYRRHRDNQFAQHVIQPKGTEVLLPCLACPSPTEEEFIEDLWKPNENILGRKLSGFWDKIKKFVKEKNQTVPSFSWEFMKFEKNSKWKPAIDLTEPRTLARKTQKAAQGLFKKKRKYEVGDHFELRINDLNNGTQGWYRCVKRTPEHFISALYFVQVVRSSDYIIRQVGEGTGIPVSNSTTPTRVYHLSQEKGIVAFKRYSPWTPCNVCGVNATGESFRRGECHIRQYKQGTVTNSTLLGLFSLFGTIPCNSALVPLNIRRLLRKYVLVQEFHLCQSVCKEVENETRVIQSVDKSGHKVIADLIPAGEFSVLERLPTLKAAVTRKVITVTEGTDFVILNCGKRGVFWHKGYKYINQLLLTTKNTTSDKNRVHLTADGQLIIRDVTLDDRDLYSCFHPPQNLLRSFKLIVNPGDRTTELIEYSKMLIRFSSCVLLLLLVMGLLAIN